MQQKNIAIIGAGLVGSLLAIYLAKKGHSITIFERRPDMRKATVQAGRSINLALSDRGILALQQVGIMDQITPITLPMHGRLIHKIDGSHAYQPYGQSGQFINSVSRGSLNKKLMELAEANGATILFNHHCQHINWDTNQITFETNTHPHPQTATHQADIIFASDGAFSAARMQHQLHQDRFEYQQSFISFGYKELTIPALPDGGFAIQKNALHIWPRGNYMLIALPNADGSFTCTLFFPFEGNPSFSSLNTIEKVASFFQNTFADAYPLMPQLATEFFANPTASLVTIKCYPWVRQNKFALIGDAAHAIVPFFGQGMNCGFEDCRILNQLMDEHADDWQTILEQYQSQRKPNADAIAQLALDNFLEMRDKVADPQFLLQKKIEGWFSQKHPHKWIPAYAQVTFSPQIPYSIAWQNGQWQQQLMQQIMALPNIETIWDSNLVEQMMMNYQ